MPKLRLLDAPSPNWIVPANIMPDTTPIYQQGAVCYANSSGQLEAIDFQTGQVLWIANSIPPGPLQSPIWVNGILYLTTDLGQMYAVSPVTGNLLWPSPVTLNSG